MSELREQLRSLKAGYQAIEYPGDLAAEVLPQRRRIPLYASWSGLAAVAAIVAVVLMLHVPPTRTRTDRLPVAPVQPVMADTGLRPIPPWPEIPTGVSLVPPMQEYGTLAPVPPPYQSFSLPAFPSFPTTSN